MEQTKKQTKKQTAVEWWNGLASLRKTQLCDINTELVGSVRWETLTNKEVQMIYESNLINKN